MEQVIQTDEEFVRGVWERAEMCETVTGPYLKYSISLGGRMFTKACVPDDWAMSEVAAWSAAAAFTRDRLEEVRQLREEIELVRPSYQTSFQIGKGSAFHDITRKKMADDALAWQRVLNRLEAALADKTAGMKEGA